MASEEIVTFVLRLVTSILPVRFHRFHKGISKELRPKALESFIWSAKS